MEETDVEACEFAAAELIEHVKRMKAADMELRVVDESGIVVGHCATDRRIFGRWETELTSKTQPAYLLISVPLVRPVKMWPSDFLRRNMLPPS
jgi:hypothetical protein